MTAARKKDLSHPSHAPHESQPAPKKLRPVHPSFAGDVVNQAIPLLNALRPNTAASLAPKVASFNASHAELLNNFETLRALNSPDARNVIASQKNPARRAELAENWRALCLLRHLSALLNELQSGLRSINQ